MCMLSYYIMCTEECLRLAYNACVFLYLVTFWLCSCRENGKDIKEYNMMQTENVNILCVNHNWMVHYPYQGVIPCRIWLHLGNPGNSQK